MNPRFLFTSRLKGKNICGDLDYQGEGDDVNEKFSKYSWFIEDDPTEIYNVLRINPTGQTYTDLEVEDVLKQQV